MPLRNSSDAQRVARDRHEQFPPRSIDTPAAGISQLPNDRQQRACDRARVCARAQRSREAVEPSAAVIPQRARFLFLSGQFKRRTRSRGFADAVEKLAPCPDAKNYLRCERCFLSLVRTLRKLRRNDSERHG